MDPEVIGVLGFFGLIALILLRMPVGLAMLVTGVVGYVAIAGWRPLLSHLKTNTYYQFSSYSLSVIPLFLLMGTFAMEAGISRSLFGAANAVFGRFRGGLAMATIGACAGFGALCGSSVATTAGMARISLGEMRRYGYADSLATGTVAVGGAIAILVPPSIILAIYGLMTEQNIAHLYIAALIPGLLAVVGYILAIGLYIRLYPGEVPAAAATSRVDTIAALRGVWPAALIFSVVIGGIYAGIFTPTEGAGVGATLTFLLALARRAFGWAGFARALAASAETAAIIFLILLGADLFNSFLALSRLPSLVSDVFTGLDVSPYVILAGMVVLYILLGCVMDELAMILLTLPIFFPIVTGLDFGMPPDDVAQWFGILILVVVGIGLVAPPVGLNVYIVNGIARDVPMVETFKGVMPFLAADIVRVALLIAFPSLTLWLVHLLT